MSIRCWFTGHLWYPKLDEIHGRELYRNVFLPMECRRCGKYRAS